MSGSTLARQLAFGRPVIAGALRSHHSGSGSDENAAIAHHLLPVASRKEDVGLSLDCAGTLVGRCGGTDEPTPIAYGGNKSSGPLQVATARSACSSPTGRLDFSTETFLVYEPAPVVTHTLRANGFDASKDGTGRGTPLATIAFDCKAGGNTGFGIGANMTTLRGQGHGGGHAAVALATPHDVTWRVRRLTPRECERLQGYPDDWTLVPIKAARSGTIFLAKDGPRYKAIGNGMAVPVMAWLGSRLAMAWAALRKSEEPLTMRA